MYNFGGDPVTQLNLINLKNVFLYEIGLIAIREVSPPFDGGHTSLSTALVFVANITKV